MQKLVFIKKIKASAQKVYETMLGLKNKSSYEYWTAIFNPTSTYEGSWMKGSKMLFYGVDENGNRVGMVSEIVENQPAKLVSIRHYGFLEGDKEVTTGEQIEKWSGAHEIYRFESDNENTMVVVELDTIDDLVAYFNETYPKALDQLKQFCEK